MGDKKIPSATRTFVCSTSKFQSLEIFCTSHTHTHKRCDFRNHIQLSNESKIILISRERLVCSISCCIVTEKPRSHSVCYYNEKCRYCGQRCLNRACVSECVLSDNHTNGIAMAWHARNETGEPGGRALRHTRGAGDSPRQFRGTGYLNGRSLLARRTLRIRLSDESSADPSARKVVRFVILIKRSRKTDRRENSSFFFQADVEFVRSARPRLACRRTRGPAGSGALDEGRRRRLGLRIGPRPRPPPLSERHGPRVMSPICEWGRSSGKSAGNLRRRDGGRNSNRRG